MIERQELYCHDCGKYVQFDLDTEMEGNHVLECPNCGHEHCRVVKNGKITDLRWDQRNGNPSNINGMQTYYVSSSTTTYTTVSTYDTYSSNGSTSDGFMYSSWMNASTSSGTYYV